MLKTKIGQEMDKWLEEKDNLELWHDKITCTTEENPHDKVGRCSMEGTGEGQ